LCALAAARAQVNPAVEARIDALLKQMTVEEKVGQMTQVAIDVVSQRGTAGKTHRIDPARLEAAVSKY
jgi:beta-glucosidase